jgi:integrase
MVAPSPGHPIEHLENVVTVINAITRSKALIEGHAMIPRINIAKRIRKRRRADGSVIEQPRFVVDFLDPQSGKRRQFFFERRKDAEVKRAELLVEMATGRYASPTTATVQTAMRNWLEDRKPKVKRVTFTTYERAVRHICEPVTTEDGSIAHPGLGKINLNDLQTAEIRRWHNALRERSGHYSASRAMRFLKAALDLAAEDFGIRPPAMPKIDRVRGKVKKTILTPEQIAKVITAAKADPERGVYVATPFLTGLRIGEMLGLQWQDIDFERNEIHVRRVQENDGKTFEKTKTEAGMRTIPIGATLRQMLIDWRERCPRLNGELVRVFPTRGKRQPWPKPRMGGKALLYSNYRTQVWRPFFAKLGLPEVTPHSARHSYISTLQAAGIEVATVAKLAGHANPTTTLSVYSHAVQGSEAVAAALEEAFAAS